MIKLMVLPENSWQEAGKVTAKVLVEFCFFMWVLGLSYTE